jgi:hypothetical protein
MVDTPRKTFPELQALSAPVVDSDVLAVYRTPGPAKRTTATVFSDYIKAFYSASGGSALVGFLQAGSGAIARTVQAKLRDHVSVKDFGAVGNGVADDTVAIQTAINSANGKKVFFPAGVYLVTDTLTITVDYYSWEGERTERGQNTQPYGSDYSAVTINFNPVDKTKFLVNKFEAWTGSLNFLGPFEHRNILFTLNGANGFQFGSESLTEADAPGGQSYISNVLFDGCNFYSTSPTFVSAADGTLVLSTRRAVGLCKAFECMFRYGSIWVDGIGVRALGSDKVSIESTRIYCQRPLDFELKDIYSVQHSVHDVQIEGWVFSPVRNEGLEVSISDARFEMNVGSGVVGVGRFVLPTCTAAVTANSATLTFSRTMANILFPGYSIIELTDGTNTDTCLVTAVSGTTVTVDTTGHRFTWSGTATTVTRIHNYGPIHTGVHSTTITNASLGAGEDAPLLVYVAGAGSMSAANPTFASFGVVAGVLVVGNRPAGQSAMNGQLTISGGTAPVCEKIFHPMVRIENWSEGHGPVDGVNNRLLGGDAFDALSRAQRKWIYSPARYQTAANNNQNVTYKQVSGDAGTTQSLWAWYLDSSLSGGRILYIYDNTLPSASAGFLRITVRARTVSGSGTLTIAAVSNLGGANVSVLTLAATAETQTFILPVPSQWGSGGTTTRGLTLTASADTYIMAVAVSDEIPSMLSDSVQNAVYKQAFRTSDTTDSGVAEVIASVAGAFNSAITVSCYGGINDASGKYATVYAQYLVQTSRWAGATEIRGVSLIYKQKQSISAGVYDLDMVITAAMVSGAVEITAESTKTGAGAATTSDFSFDIETLGDTLLAITAV